MSLILALLVLLATALVDALFAAYTRLVVAQSPAMASTLGSAIHLINGFVVIEYTHDWRYILFVAIGSWGGTYLTVRFWNRDHPAPGT